MQIDSQAIVLIIAVLTFLITAGTLVWRLAVLNQQCVSNKESVTKAHARIDKLENEQHVKIDELKNQVGVVEKTQIRMEEKLNYLIKVEKQNRGVTHE